VERVVYAQEDSGFAVLAVREPSGITAVAVGPLLGSGPGESLRLTGSWVDHPKYGRRFEVEAFAALAPTTVDGLERYLGSGMMPGIGATYAKRIVATFGLKTLEVLDSVSKRLTEVPGIGPKRATALAQAWHAQRELRGVMLFLQQYGISPNHANRIYRQFGARSRAVLQDDPYSIVEHIAGVGFHTADLIAAKLGIAADSPQRAAAGVLHVLSVAASAGDSYLPTVSVIEQAVALLSVAPAAVAAALQVLVAAARLSQPEPDKVYLPRLYRVETAAAQRLGELLVATPAVNVSAAAALPQHAGARVRLSDEQQAAFATLITAKVVVLTGGPGTGKTTLLQSLVDAFTSARAQVLQAAPTGRAAKRMEEASGHPAATVHRLLEVSPKNGSFGRDASNPLEVDVLVVDEASMLDIYLLAALLVATPLPARLIMVGDADQLPSVGPGNVLADLVAASSVPTVRLTEVFRQAERSRIVAAAHQVNTGRFRATEYVAKGPASVADGLDADCFVLIRNEPEQIARTVLNLVTDRIPQRFDLRPERDIQVLTPMNRGPLGSRTLNGAVRERIQPGGDAVAVHGQEMSAGDRVIQTRNNYQLEVFNGDVGRIVAVNAEDLTLAVDFAGRRVAYSHRDLEDLSLGYAITIHRSQGSEFPVVVLPLHTQHYVMLRRNLFYTAITRARQLLVIVGSELAIDMAARRGEERARYSRLQPLLEAAVTQAATSMMPARLSPPS
jgi:exodeoxyribonuclease V alpha subunit